MLSKVLIIFIGMIAGAALSYVVPAHMLVIVLGLFIPLLVFVRWFLNQEKQHIDQKKYQDQLAQALIRERERIYRNLHDDIGAQLLNLVYRAPNPEAADLARVALQNMREAIAKTVDKQLSLPELLGDMRQEMEARLVAVNIKLNWNVPIELPDYVLKAKEVITISRIFREALSNSLKHSQASEVSMIVDDDGKQVSIELIDNGALGKKQGTRGQGLKSMQERASQISAHLESGPCEKGGFRTCLKLTVNL
ncbi:MAG: sensor histidine kinase [bacterium]